MRNRTFSLRPSEPTNLSVPSCIARSLHPACSPTAPPLGHCEDWSVSGRVALDSASREYSDEPLEGAAGIDQLLPLVCEVLLKTFLNKTNNPLLKIKTFF